MVRGLVEDRREKLRGVLVEHSEKYHGSSFKFIVLALGGKYGGLLG